MKSICFRRRGVMVGAAAIAAFAIAGGIAYATIPGPDKVFAACMLKNVGVIRLIDKSLPTTNLMSHCTDKEIEVFWNQAGQPGPAGPQGPKGDPGEPGKDGANGTNGTDGKGGVSVTTASEPAGANCAGGGVELTAVNGFSYVCNGKDGADGQDGANGTNGADGHDGVSVTSAGEPAGSNCANGGSKFTAANGVTYACNGAPGTGGATGWVRLVSEAISVPPGDQKVKDQSCPTGKRALGGGFAAHPDLNVSESSPEDTYWTVRAYNPTTTSLNFWVYVICAQISG
jgi:hypothetical protein